MTKYSQTGQTSVILRYLQTFKNQWIPVHQLGKTSGSMNVCNRIRDARKRGFTIINRVTQGSHGIKHSEYKLVTK